MARIGRSAVSVVPLIVAPVVAGAFDTDVFANGDRPLVWTAVAVLAALAPVALLVPLGWAGRLSERQAWGLG
ncbi:MAG: hypothetical protein KJN81_12460, partial [Acidimicrobiia bacterium]|nr:hypothetical protein [Acidimicrobiia bacterium]